MIDNLVLVGGTIALIYFVYTIIKSVIDEKKKEREREIEWRTRVLVEEELKKRGIDK